MAEMLPFPLARRRAFVCRHADIALSYDAEAGERHIQRQVKEQTATLTRKGRYADSSESAQLNMRP